MLPTTAAFKKAIRSSHQVITRAEVRSPSGNLLLNLLFSAGIDKGDKLSAGKVNIDGENNIRRTFDLTILTDPDPTKTLVPANYSSILAPFANEVWIYRGVQYDTSITLLDGNVSNQEFVLCGKFRLTDFDAFETNHGISMSLKGEDRSNYISLNTWSTPYQLTSGAELSIALQAMISNRYPACQFNFTPTPFIIGTIVFGTTIGGDPWADAVRLANLCGQDLYFDANGICVLKPLPVLSGSVPIVIQTQGASDFTIIDAHRSMTNKNVFNSIVLDVQPTDGSAPYRIIAQDLNPASPTYVGGSFGVVSKTITTSIPTTTQQAAAVAQALLNQYIGAQDSHVYSSVCDPSVDIYDILQVTIAGLNINSNLIIDSGVIPLDVSTPAALTCRTVIQRSTIVT